MSFGQFAFDEALVVSGHMSSAGSKREREEVDSDLGDDIDNECAFESAAKKISMVMGPEDEDVFAPHPVVPAPPLQSFLPPAAEEMKPYPYFNYRNFSTETDPDPLTPLTPPGRVPNFPAKMQAILSRTDLEDIISWMPHGRAWRVHKPREFEVRVVPTYFEHAKFSSFIRQANGWGFRRITHGRDKNCYYHPLFLRGLPYLCKKMKRPGVSEKINIDPDHEPDLYRISEEYPVPMKTDDESVLLHCTLQGGPKARMPIYSAPSAMTTSSRPVNSGSSGTAIAKLTPSDQQALAAFQQSLGASESQLAKTDFAAAKTTKTPASQAAKPVQAVVSRTNMMTAAPAPFTLPFNAGTNSSPLVLANQLAFSNPNMSEAMQSGSAASQFAAGFAAATALSQQQFQQMLAALQQQGIILPGAATLTTAQQAAPMLFPLPMDQDQPAPSTFSTDNLLAAFADDDFGIPADAIGSPDDFWQ